jgi:hypothetical protein
MAESRYPRAGHRVAPAMLRTLLEVPVPAAYAAHGGPMLLADLDETTWQRFSDAECRALSRLVVRTVASKARAPTFPGHQHVPRLPEGLTLADLDLEVRTRNALAAAGIHERPRDLPDLTLDDLLALRGFWVKSLVDLLTSLEHAASHQELHRRAGPGPTITQSRLRARRGYPRLGQRLAPQILREMLLERLPLDLVQGTVFEGRRLCDLDEQVWDELTLEVIACLGGSIVACAEKAGSHRLIAARALPPLPRSATWEGLAVDEATLKCLRRRGLVKSPEQLGHVTVGQLLTLYGFDSKCLVDLLTAVESAAGQGSQLHTGLTAEAVALRDLPESALIHFHDPRLGPELRALDTEASTVREMAELMIARRLDPPAPELLCQQFRRLREKIGRLKELPLDEELSQVFGPGSHARDQEILAGYYGWDGLGGRPAETVGKKYGLSRERVRQICGLAVRRLRSVRVFAPALDRALAFMAGRPPTPLAKLQAEFDAARIASRPFPLASLDAVARLLSREPPFEIVPIGRLHIVAGLKDARDLGTVFGALRRVTRKCGLGSLDQLGAALGRSGGVALDRDFMRQAIQELQGFRWLDKRRNWFHVGYSEHFGLPNMVRKVLSVAKRIDVALLRAAIARSRRHGPDLPPVAIFLEYCRHMPGVRVERSSVIADPPRDWRKVLSGVERTLVEVLKKHGPIMERSVLEEHCLRRGMNGFTFNAIVTNSPVVLPYGRCLYGLIGAMGDRRAMSRLVAKRPPRSAPRVLTGHGQTQDGRIYIAYRLSPAVVSSGIVTVPSAVGEQVRGQFTIRKPDGCKAGVLSAKRTCAWGLRPALRAQGAQPGDHLLLLINPAMHELHLHLGNETVLDTIKRG